MKEICMSLAGLVCFMPLIGALTAGLFAKRLGRMGAQFVTILGVSISFFSALLLHSYIGPDTPVIDERLYSWIAFGPYQFEVGFWLDQLSVSMMLVVTSISLLVHIYSMGYMEDDPGVSRFFAYVSFFTFAMLMLVSANNLLQVFFGWEGVGVASYLLIGFWYHKPSAANGAFKAFVVNRVGDFGFMLALGLFVCYAGSLNFAEIYQQLPALSQIQFGDYLLVDWICFLLFIGAMGKSAQMPLHIWLPESMEGPTPISALIHAATMVTAGVYLLVRFSPLFEFSATVRSLILVIGASGGLFLGLIAIVNDDIKRVVAYSTLSQLGYMMSAVGASAYGLAMFHLITHAFFKALLFLAAGAVIVAAHHEQNMQKFGGLFKHIPLIGTTFLVGSLSLMAVPLFSGFYSKDAIILAVQNVDIWGGTYAYCCLLAGVMVTSIYSVRAFYLTFLGNSRFKGQIHHVPKSINIPLILLAIPSVCLGFIMAPSAGDLKWFNDAVFYTLQTAERLSPVNNLLASPLEMAGHALESLPFFLMILSSAITYIIYAKGLEGDCRRIFSRVVHVLAQKLYFDWVVDRLLLPLVLNTSRFFSEIGDRLLIDRTLVLGSAQVVSHTAKHIKGHISGYLYHYALLMLCGVGVFCYLVVMI